MPTSPEPPRTIRRVRFPISVKILLWFFLNLVFLGAAAWIFARVPARDPLLDAMAFSKARFAVEVPGSPALYVPSYPEVTKVIEDCR